MLTPWNDPESSFAQRPIPPSAYEHSVIIEVQLRRKTNTDLKSRQVRTQACHTLRGPCTCFLELFITCKLKLLQKSAVILQSL